MKFLILALGLPLAAAATPVVIDRCTFLEVCNDGMAHHCVCVTTPCPCAEITPL
jgi:hypothetical protein